MQRRSTPTKAYVALFTCMSTKTIHLELVPDLSSKKFIDALERMIARRGYVKHIYSENSTNFIGANYLLCELKQMLASEDHRHQTHSFCADNGITWHFIPPRFPHFGGFWEAGIKTIKHHFKRVLGTNILPYDEFETLLIKIEACVNTRPLTSLSNDPNDLSPLTPGHFLTGSNPLSSIPSPDLSVVNVNRLDQSQRLQRMYQNFWRRWSNEYLSTL
ncbi:uncharacterized protein LOC142317658 [Lycorma delicatula]|uniref:uncharacterized protein LOC142317658 n=1 Tax=Lycorma delicatula TaxID=130591 RepID=UPI003F50D95D